MTKSHCYVAALLSAFSYKDHEHDKDRVPLTDLGELFKLETGFTDGIVLADWKFIDNVVSDAQAICCRDPALKTTYVVFRGTDSKKDAAVDVQVTKMCLPLEKMTLSSDLVKHHAQNARVHAGFMYQLASIQKELFAYINEVSCRDELFVFTGHSLGGALATLACTFFCIFYPDRETMVHTFGSPRVGNAAFSRLTDALHANIHRHVYCNDPVTRMPTRLRWKHCGKMIACNRDGHDHTKTTLSDSGDGWWNCVTLPNPFRVSDHDMQNYVSSSFVCKKSTTLGENISAQNIKALSRSKIKNWTSCFFRHKK